jgi:hypothetical protein
VHREPSTYNLDFKDEKQGKKCTGTYVAWSEIDFLDKSSGKKGNGRQRDKVW